VMGQLLSAIKAAGYGAHGVDLTAPATPPTDTKEVQIYEAINTLLG
jgi:hypothetical protein